MGKRRPYEVGGVSGLEFGSRVEYITRGASNGSRPAAGSVACVVNYYPLQLIYTPTHSLVFIELVQLRGSSINLKRPLDSIWKTDISGNFSQLSKESTRKSLKNPIKMEPSSFHLIEWYLVCTFSYLTLPGHPLNPHFSSSSWTGHDSRSVIAAIKFGLALKFPP